MNEENKWWVDKSPSNWLVYGKINNVALYGIDIAGEWDGQDYCIRDEYMRLATPREIEVKLLAYADKHYPKGAVCFDLLNVLGKVEISDTNVFYIYESHVYITNGNGGVIYKDGKWAEIVDSPIFNFIEDEIYVYKEWIFRSTGNNKSGYIGMKEQIDTEDRALGYGSALGKINSDKINHLRLATKQEKEHLQQCINIGEYVDYCIDTSKQLLSKKENSQNLTLNTILKLAEREIEDIDKTIAELKAKKLVRENVIKFHTDVLSRGSATIK